MKKIVPIVIGVVALGLIIYFATANKDDSSPTDSTRTEAENSQTNEQEGPIIQKSSLKDLVSGTPKQCTYAVEGSEGTVYTSNAKARMDMSMVTNGVTMAAHAIMDGTTYYQWVDGQSQGFKFSVGASAGSAGPNQNVDMNQQLDYNCQNWSADSSKFDLPANVEFTDMSSYMPSM